MNTTHQTPDRIEEKKKLIKGWQKEITGTLDSFFDIGGIHYPTNAIMSLLSDYLHVCGEIERLARSGLYSKGAEREFIPSFHSLASTVATLSTIIDLITETGENMNRIASAQLEISLTGEDCPQ